MENLLTPDQAITNLPGTKVLVLAPHPDDEVFGCGGAIMRHVEQNSSVSVIIMTDGTYGVEQTQVADYATQRQNESIAAANVLGYGTPIFWHYQDRELSYSEKLVQKVIAAITETDADLIYAPSVLEIHPDHRALGMIAIEATRRLGNAKNLALYEIGAPLHPNQLLDISSLATRKMDAMACFVSQNTKQRYDLDIAALNRYRTYTLPANVSAAEAYILVTANELLKDPLKLYQSEHARQKTLGLALDRQDIPLVSVIVRSMDRPTLSDALDSVALQTYANIEVVIVNAKGSAHRELDEWCGHFPMRIVEYGKPLARSQAANAGLKAAHGTYLIFLDDDDWFAPHHINALATELERSKSTMVAYSAVQCINAAGDEIRRFEEDFDPTQLRIDNYIPIHAALFRRSVVDKGVHFDEMLPFCEDWDFWLQILEHGDFRFIAEVGAIYRMQNEANSGVWDNAAHTQQLMTVIYKKWMPRWSNKTIWSILEYSRYKRLFDELSLSTNTQIATFTQSLAERDAQMTQRDSRITELNTTINNLMSSTSWRITKPIRAIKKFIQERNTSK